MIGAFATVLKTIPVPLGKVQGTLMTTLPIGIMVLYGASEAVCLSAVAMAFSTGSFNVGEYGISMCMMVDVYRVITRA